ncbi:uncharacterized protein [Drosophila kikkawai]|uniref:DUF5641 domain-containing protein n=1 Tax=Drosophila kikkawai TaxID=30033 RepID=A0ABM4GQG6_DROKI
MLHREVVRATPSPPLPSQPQSNAPQISNAVVHTHRESQVDRVILATALVLVKDASGCYKIGRALLDSCSQVNFMSDEFAQALRIPRIKRHMEIRSIGESQTQIKHRASTTIKSRFNALELSLDFCITSHIAYNPDSDIDISSWQLPQNTPLADDKFNKSRRIDLLLGTETFFEILSVGQIKLGPHLPILQKTLLGWIISGRCQTKPTIVHSYSLTLEDAINRNVERLWKIEDVSKSADIYTPEQRKCEEKFVDSVRRDDDGRIVVRLPFKTDPSLLGNSYETARRRFQALERRLSRSADMRSKYIDFMQEFEALGHMSLVEMPRLNVPHFYIPHHCALKPTSTSTKLRVVFDASCQTTSQKSLNDLLMVGPTIQPDLYTLLLRFRTYRYVITADVVKMFRQVLVDADDRKFQYILWRSNPVEPVRTFELNTVTYGTATAPYLAIRSMIYLADQYSNQFKVGADAIKTSFYVDDFLCGADTVDGLARIKAEVSEILSTGGFELAKWHSNYTKFVDDRTIKDLNLEEDSVTSTLDYSGNIDPDVVLLEKRKSAFTIVTINNRLLEAVYTISSHNRCILVVAWVLRFVHFARKLQPFATLSPSPQELSRALHCICWNLQAKHFSEDIGLLQKGKPTRTNLRNLNPFLQVTDGFELLKVGGRLELANFPDSHRHPILLPSKDFFVHQYVQHIHLKNFHAGPKALVALLRLRFWIVNARDLARRVVRSCVHCVRYRPTLEKQVMGQLPVERLKQAPHFGGLWEAAVKSVKGLLNRTLANTRLTFEELTTVTAEVEAILNSRPLSPLSTDPNDLAALTPGHFLVGDSLRSLPEPSVEDSKVDHLERWQRVSAIKQYLWRRWSHEYINELQMRTNWTQASPNLSVGDMVLIHEDNLPPQRWLLGRIEAAIPDKDQRVRIADVRTAKGVYRRPTHKLALLPVS